MYVLRIKAILGQEGGVGQIVPATALTSVNCTHALVFTNRERLSSSYQKRLKTRKWKQKCWLQLSLHGVSLAAVPLGFNYSFPGWTTHGDRFCLVNGVNLQHVGEDERSSSAALTQADKSGMCSHWNAGGGGVQLPSGSGLDPPLQTQLVVI